MKLMDKSLEILGWMLFALYIFMYAVIREIAFEGQVVYSNAEIVYKNIVEILPFIGVSIVFSIIYFITVDIRNRIVRSILAIVLVIFEMLSVRMLPGAVSLEGFYLRNRDAELIKLCETIEALVMFFTIVCLFTILVALILIIAVKSNRLSKVDNKVWKIQMSKTWTVVIVGLNIIISIFVTDLMLNGYGPYVGYEPLMLPATMFAAIILPIMVYLIFIVNSFVLQGKVKKTVIGYFVYMLLVKIGMEMVHRSASMYYARQEIWNYNNGITTDIAFFGRLDIHMFLVYVVMGIYTIAFAWNAGMKEGMEEK